MVVYNINQPHEYLYIRGFGSADVIKRGEKFMKILLATFWEVPHVGGVWNYMQQLKKNLKHWDMK